MPQHFTPPAWVTAHVKRAPVLMVEVIFDWRTTGAAPAGLVPATSAGTTDASATAAIAANRTRALPLRRERPSTGFPPIGTGTAPVLPSRIVRDGTDQRRTLDVRPG